MRSRLRFNHNRFKCNKFYSIIRFHWNALFPLPIPHIRFWCSSQSFLCVCVCVYVCVWWRAVFLPFPLQLDGRVPRHHSHKPHKCWLVFSYLLIHGISSTLATICNYYNAWFSSKLHWFCNGAFHWGDVIISLKITWSGVRLMSSHTGFLQTNTQKKTFTPFEVFQLQIIHCPFYAQLKHQPNILTEIWNQWERTSK